MQKLQDSVFSIFKTTSLSPAVFSYLQPSEDFPDKTPLGGILSDTKHGWLALGPKFCVVDLRTGIKVAQRTFGTALSNYRTHVTSVVELPKPLTENSQQLLISLECEDIAGMICVFHINGSQLLRCIQTEVVVTELAVCDVVPDGPLSCFDGAVMAGTKTGEIFVFDLNRSCLIHALKSISLGYDNPIRGEENLAAITFLPLNAVSQIERQRELVLENDDHIAVLLNENSLVEGQYILRNPDGSVRMKAKRDQVRVTVIKYIPQLATLAVGFNFGAFQLWNLMNLDLEFISQVNVECLPVTHFGFQEPCDDPRAFCYLWAVFSVIDRFDEEEFPLAVMYSLTYQGKRMLSDTKCLYQEFITANIRFQLELSALEDDSQLVGGRCVSCHTYSVNSMLGGEGEESMLNICQLVWECWCDNANSPAQYGMLMFDLDQWYKDQMPATYPLQSNAFMSATRCSELSRGATTTLDVRLIPSSVSVYCAATRLEEHFYPNSLRYDCICLNTSEACTLSTTGIQRQIINSLDEVGPTALLNPTRLYHACVQTGLVPLYTDPSTTTDQEEQRRYLLSVALEARLSRFLKRCARDWATPSHLAAHCTLTFLVDWCWKRAIELKENARELTAPLFTSAALPDRNVIRCLEHCVQQLTQLTGLLDAVLTKCCNLVVPDALSEIEEKYKGIGTVSLYFQVVQWFLRVGLLPERQDACNALPYPGHQLVSTYNKRRLKLHRLQDHNISDENAAKQSCPLLYIDQLIEQEFGGERIHQMWIRAGSECNGLYPPPSLYSLLRLYLLPDIAEEHKHSLVLYLLQDYSMLVDEVRHEAVIRKLMQFPTMFGLSNTAIKATQAFWHLDHRDFDFALDQLQCLTGNTLSDWQHHVVLSSLLAQKKTQAALQYLHVRKPAPIQMDPNSSEVRELDKLDDWQSCCDLYLARGLVFEALDVVRMCVAHASSLEDKVTVLNYFFKVCKNTGQLAKILQVTLLPFEEEVFIRYLENCNESQTSDILIMYYLQQARYLEAEQYNKRIKHSKSRVKDFSTSLESLADLMDRESARDTLVEVMCSALPDITNTVAHAIGDKDWEPHVVAPKPMSVYIQANSPKNTFIYKSSFIQNTIESASETWMNRPKARKGLKRALNIEDTPFICTPKLNRSRTIFGEDKPSESTPPKRARLDLTGTPKTPRVVSAVKVNANVSHQLSMLLDMPDVQTDVKMLYHRSGADTPHSILKIRTESLREAMSPVDSRYLGESDDELLETASNHTHYSDSTNKHLRFTIPTASESGSTPSPTNTTSVIRKTETELSAAKERERDANISLDSYVTTESHAMTESHPLESPPKRRATEENIQSRKSYKDSVRGRRSLSLSANSSLAEEGNSSIESIADIPVTLINPRYCGERRRSMHVDTSTTEERRMESTTEERPLEERDKDSSRLELPKTPRGRRGIRAVSGESTPLKARSRSQTPERADSPIITTPLCSLRSRTRSRSQTPEVSPRSALDSIPEQPRQETESEPHPQKTTLSAPRLRSRSCTPERIEKEVESPRLEAITESPTKSPPASPTRERLRSRSHTPELEPRKEEEQTIVSPRTLRSRAKTPEKQLLSPKKDAPKSAKKPLSRIVLEANAYAAAKQLESKDEEQSAIECTPMKTLKAVPSLMDVTISPIVSKSILHSSNESVLSESATKDPKSTEESLVGKCIPAFTMNETKFGKSVLHSYESSVAEITHEETKSKSRIEVSVSKVEMKSIPAFTLNESYFEKSVLRSYESSMETSTNEENKETEKGNEFKSSPATTSFNITDFNKSVLESRDTSLAASQDKTKDTSEKNMSSLMTSDSEIEDWKDKKEEVIQKEKEKIVEIEREINEIEHEMSEDESGVTDEEIEDSDDEESSGVDVGDEEESDAESGSSAEDDSEMSSAQEVISIADTDESGNNSNLQIDEDQPNREQIEMVETGDKTRIKDSNDAKEVTESTDPLNQAQISLLTDDNSLHSDKSEGILNYSEEEKKEDTPMETETLKEPAENTPESSKKTVDPMDTSEQTKKPSEMGTAPIDIPIKQTEVAEEEKVPETVDVTPESSKKTVEPMDTSEQTEKPTEMGTAPIDIPKEQTEVAEKEKNPETVDIAVATDKIIESEKGTQDTEETVSIDKEQITEDVSEENKSKPASRTKKRTRSTTSNTSVKKGKEKPSKTKQDAKVKTDEIVVAEKATQDSEETVKCQAKSQEKETKDEGSPKKPELRKKRTRSTASNKSVTETEVEPRTPVTRKRSQSIASNKSATEEQKTPENISTTPSRSRSKTPTSVEVRKIVTRRASKETTGKLDESVTEDLTPSRRTTRSQSRNLDDNASVASDKSIRSTRSRESEDGNDVKPRRGKKSLLPVKPELSVIPEATVEDASKNDSKEEIIADYSRSRRLTRHQKSVLESWLTPKPSPSRRRASNASKTSVMSNTSSQAVDEDDASSTHSSAFDVQPIDRISLLNKGDFDGSPDSSEVQSTVSPESIASDASKQRRGRAVSESKSTPKARAVRRVSLDVESPSASRGRRASFTRAIVALHTPTKGRRTSTDLRKGDTGSVHSSPGSEGEATHSTSHNPNTSTSRRTRKVSAVEENKDTKK